MPNTTERRVIAGYGTALGMAQELTYGTAVAPSLYLPFTQHTLNGKNNLVMSQVVRKSAGMPIPGAGSFEAAGGIDLDVDLTSIGLVLGASMGQGSDAVTGSSAPYTHVYSLKGESNSYTFSADDNNGSVSQFTGCKVTQLDFSGKAGQILTAKVTVSGQTDAVLTTSSLSPTFSNSVWLEWAHLSACTINGTNVQLADFNISLKNTVKLNMNSLGGRFATSATTVQRQVSGTMSVKYDTSIKDLIKTQVYGAAAGPIAGVPPQNALVLTFTPPGSIGSLSFSIPAFTMSEAPLTRKRGDELVHAVKFDASESTPGAGNDLQVTLINSNATAYA